MERIKAQTAMKHIRIGKDIRLSWSILTDGSAVPLEGRDLTLELKSPIGKVIILPYRVDGNVLTITYYGYEQTVVGEYSLTLWENKGKPGQNVVDAIRAFKLVRTSPEEEDFAGGDLQVESVDLGTANLEILSGGGAATPGESPDLSALEGKVAANTASISKINAELGNVKEVQEGQNNSIGQISTTLEEHTERISQLESSTPGGDSEAIAQINSTLQGIKNEQTEQNNRLADHEERLVYTEGDLVKVRSEYNSIISDLRKSIWQTQKAFVVETNDSDGVIYIDNVKTIIPPNSTKGFIFQNNFRGGNSGIASFRFLITNTSGITYMHTMFQGCSALTSLDLSSFDTSKVTAMSYMFHGCSALTSLDLSSFDTSAVTTMSAMFLDCNSLTSLDLSSFDTSVVTDMNAMFSGCSALTSIDLSNFDTSSVAGMASMFNNCYSLTSVDLSNFDTSAVTTMGSMFKGCITLASIDLSTFDTRLVSTMTDMFRGCSSLTHIDVSNFNTTLVTTMRVMFGSCSSLTSLDLSNFDTSAVTIMDFMFQNCPSLTNLILGPKFFKTSAVTSIDFSSCAKWTNETVVTSLVTNAYDRAAAGLNTLTIKLHANTKAALTDEQKATITNKGYTIA